MAKKYTGAGRILPEDYKDVCWIGKTKGGKAITIKLKDAINMGNIDWAFAEKNDTVANVVFTATYDNTDEMAQNTEEPWEIECADEVTAGAGEILLGSGAFQVGGKTIALTRGGGSFNVTRTFRQINADGDRGPVKDRIEITDSTATLTLNVLTILTKFADLYAGISEAN